MLSSNYSLLCSWCTIDCGGLRWGCHNIDQQLLTNKSSFRTQITRWRETGIPPSFLRVVWETLLRQQCENRADGKAEGENTHFEGKNILAAWYFPQLHKGCEYVQGWHGG